MVLFLEDLCRFVGRFGAVRRRVRFCEVGRRFLSARPVSRLFFDVRGFLPVFLLGLVRFFDARLLLFDRGDDVRLVRRPLLLRVRLLSRLRHRFVVRERD